MNSCTCLRNAGGTASPASWVQSPADHDADNEDRGEYANDGPIDEQVRVEHGAHLRIARQGNARPCLMFRSFFEHGGTNVPRAR